MDPGAMEDSSQIPKRRALWLLILVLPLMVATILAGAGPADGRTVVVYTAMPSDASAALTPAFEQATGIRVEVLHFGSAEVFKRLEAEQAQPACDVVWGAAPDQFATHAALLEPPGEVRGLEAVDPAFQGSAAWLPWSGLLPVLIVNTTLCPGDQAPRAWRELGDPRFAGKIAAARPDKSGSAYMQLAVVLDRLGEEQGWPVLAATLGNTRLESSSSAVPRLVNDGEAAVGLTLEDQAWRYVRGGGPVRLVYPSEGTGAVADGVALLRRAPHPEEGRTFLAWTLGVQAQTLLATKVGRRPVRKDVPLPEGLPPLAEVAVRYPLERAAEDQERVLARWRELLGAK